MRGAYAPKHKFSLRNANSKTAFIRPPRVYLCAYRYIVSGITNETIIVSARVISVVTESERIEIAKKTTEGSPGRLARKAPLFPIVCVRDSAADRRFPQQFPTKD